MTFELSDGESATEAIKKTQEPEVIQRHVDLGLSVACLVDNLMIERCTSQDRSSIINNDTDALCQNGRSEGGGQADRIAI